MRIVIDARSMGSRPSGVGMYVYNFIKELMKFDFKIILLSDVEISSQIQELKLCNLAVYCYGKPVYQNREVMKYFKYINEKLIELQPELFWEPNALIPINIKGFKGKIAITIHDIFPITHSNYYSQIYRFYFTYSIKKAIKQADAIIYNSMETKDKTETLYKKAKNKMSLLGSVIAKDKKLIENENNVQHYEPFFLYVGNIEKRKGVDLLIKAYLQYRRDGGKKALYLVGKMRETDLERLINKAKQECQAIYYLGYIEEKEVDELLGACSCFVFPTKAEGFGLPLIEAMEYNKPIIASNLTIFQEIAENCINYFELGNDEVHQLYLKMFNYTDEVNTIKYTDVKNRYLGSKLGLLLSDFFKKIAD
ncbi:glycosyltransferase family 4 protein [Anaerocolumna jejuensis]|uniref:glycosyltransferase family 4 protein n=1 Tax=Anaerocolumna jejuensis TaxID=259063 RepID=UPI003F7BB050